LVRRVSRLMGERRFAPSKSRKPGLFSEKKTRRMKDSKVSICGGGPPGKGKGEGGEEERETRLTTTLVSDNPESGTDETSPEPVGVPESEREELEVGRERRGK